MFKHCSALLLAAVLGLGVVGCATTATSIEAQWVNPNVAGTRPVKSLMVMSAVRDSTNRRIFEDRMVAALGAAGVKAVQSYKFIPEEGPVGEDRLRTLVAQAGVTHAMVARIINVSTQVNVSPGMMTKRYAPATLGESSSAWTVTVLEPAAGRSSQNAMKFGNSSGRGSPLSTARPRADSPNRDSPPTARK